MSAFAKLALAAVLALGVALGLKLEDAAPPPHAPASALAAPHLDATSYAEARQMRRALTTLAGQTASGGRCDPRDRAGRYAPCVTPALRHAGIGGQMAVNVLTAVLTAVPSGPCKGYLLGLQAAAQAAGEQARWLLPTIYGPDRQRAQHEVSTQIRQITHMLRNAASAAPANVCAATAKIPAV
jgi:hypothetical protein